jgi:glycosyltransferase involved in cell wall biosynthesis
MLEELPKADVVHVRCPANISLIALVLLTVLRYPRKRWFKYAGNWKPERGEPLSYTIQRWWLRKGWHRGVVTVNGEWPNQPSFVHTFLNPCLNYEELIEGRQLLGTRQISVPVRLIFAGRLDTAKGADRVLLIMARLKKLGVAATLDLIGDGEERLKFEQLARSLGIQSQVSFHGWLPRPSLGQLYSRAHLILLPSMCSEGWPKVLSEAMAYGVVSIASNVGSIPQYFKKFRSGRTYASSDVDSFAQSIQWYLTHPGIWKEESENAVEAAKHFSYANYLQAVRDILDLPLASSHSLRANELV